LLFGHQLSVLNYTKISDSGFSSSMIEIQYRRSLNLSSLSPRIIASGPIRWLYFSDVEWPSPPYPPPLSLWGFVLALPFLVSVAPPRPGTSRTRPARDSRGTSLPKVSLSSRRSGMPVSSSPSRSSASSSPRFVWMQSFPLDWAALYRTELNSSKCYRSTVMSQRCSGLNLHIFTDARKACLFGTDPNTCHVTIVIVLSVKIKIVSESHRTSQYL